MSIRRHLQRHLVIVGGLAIAVGVVASSDTLHDAVDSIIVFSEAAIYEAPVSGMLVFVALSAMSAMVAFFSSAMLAPIAIVAWGQSGTLVLLWLGWLLGGIASYCIGRFFGRSIAAMLIGDDKIAGWERQVSRRSRFVHILALQAVVPSEIPGYVLGILHFRFLLYMAALALTEMPYALAVVYLGESFLDRNVAVFVLLGVALLVLAAFGMRLLRKLQAGDGERNEAQ